jgi:RNA polymerase sigma-70 factor (ECF subfamily)
MSKNPKITDEEIALIKSAQSGNIQAYNKLYYKYRGFTTNILYKYIKDFDEAKEVNNIVWLKVYNKLSKFVNYTSFGGWLRILTNHTAVDYLREMKNLTYAPEGAEEKISESPMDVDYGQSEVDRLTYNQVVEEFKRFPEDVRKVFKLFYVDNLKVDDISAVTGIPVGTVKSHLSRKRKKLKQMFNR